MSQSPEFPGWDAPRENWSKLPHDLISLLPRMKESELKVTLYILRHTWGFSNFDDFQFMTVDEIMNGRKIKGGERLDSGTGLSKQSVLTGTKAGIQRGTLLQVVNSKDKARIRKGYKLRGGSKIWTPGVKNLDLELYKDTPKEKEIPRRKAGKRAPTDRARFIADMERTFSKATNIPLPKRVTEKDRRAAGTRWNNPLWNLYDLFRPEEERQGEEKKQYVQTSLDNTLTLIGLAIAQMQADKLTISAPASIEQAAIAIFSTQFANRVTETDASGFWDQYK